MESPNMNDSELLPAYAKEGSEAAFDALVERYLNLVYASAFRQLRDPHRAEEVCQAVFILLARKAGSIRNTTILPGWLFRTTRFVAAKAVRTEQRRLQREREAMELPSHSSPSAWDEAEPLLDEAVSRLGTSDRDAILLRFFQNKSHKEIASALGTTEDGARKRVTRAVEKLRSFFARKDILISVAVLGEALSSLALRAAPEGLGSVIKTLGRSGKASVPVAVTAMISEALREMAWFKARIALGAAGVVVAIAVVAQLLWQTGELPATSANERSANQTATPTSGISPVLLAQSGTGASTQETMLATRLPLRVVDAADGHSLAGARMIVTYWGRTDTSSPRIDLTTDVQGRADVPLAGKEFSLVRVWISGEGHAPKVIDWHRFEFNRQPAEYLVRLEHGLILAGVVEDESGHSVSGARLQTTGPGFLFSSRENISYHPDLSQVITDTAGHWFFRQAPVGYDSLTFSVSHPDFAKTSATLPLSGQDTTNAVIVLSRGVTLAGRVVNTNGEPVAGATVREDGGPEASNKTDEGGHVQTRPRKPRPIQAQRKGCRLPSADTHGACVHQRSGDPSRARAFSRRPCSSTEYSTGNKNNSDGRQGQRFRNRAPHRTIRCAPG
jgi:RNA polymerase sigma factor (sigma-70 family)